MLKQGYKNSGVYVAARHCPSTATLTNLAAFGCAALSLQTHHIDLKLFEMLWLHSIVHALDHHSVSELVLGGKLLFGITNIWQDSSTYSRIRTFLFARLFAQEVLSPLPWVSNRMEDVARGYSWVVPLSAGAAAFWRDLYAALQDLDADLAAHMTCSIMY